MRHAHLKERVPTLGEVPGTLLRVGEKKSDTTSITLIEYSAEALEETRFDSVEDGLAYQPRQPVLWLNVYGHDPEAMRAIGERFHLHPLVLEDILNARQRPKVEDYGDYLFMATRVFYFPSDHETSRLRYDQVYFVIGENFVLTFQERPLGIFETVRERLRTARGLIRGKGADYLAYSLIDALIDDYFGVINQLTEQVEQADRALLVMSDGAVLRRIQRLKHDCLKLRRSLLPMREILTALNRGDYGFFKGETLVYMRDAYDHTLHLLESVEMSRENVSDMLELYMSTQSNRLNVQMRVLTVITMIFMPLTLIAGIYGMNFKYMPELEWHYGYYYSLALMGAIAVAMSVWFWRRRWL